MNKLSEFSNMPKWFVGFEGEGQGGGNEPDLSSLEGLSDDDLDALEELKGLTPEQLKVLTDELEKGDEKDQIIAGQKEALRKERQTRRALAKELKTLKASAGTAGTEGKGGKSGEGKKGSEDDEDDVRSAKSAAELKEVRDKSERLAAKLATNAVDTAIVKLAPQFKFRDVDDALAMVKRSDIDVEQDDDDPADVEVDEDTVKDALKALAKRKPHLLIQTNDSEGQGGQGGQGGSNGSGSGSKFGGGQGNGRQATADAALKQKYPALARRR